MKESTALKLALFNLQDKNPKDWTLIKEGSGHIVKKGEEIIPIVKYNYFDLQPVIDSSNKPPKEKANIIYNNEHQTAKMIGEINDAIDLKEREVQPIRRKSFVDTVRESSKSITGVIH